MKTLCKYFIILLTCAGCAKQPTLPANSRFNVTSMLNDTSWYGTGKVLRIKEAAQQLNDVRQFNLVVFTDIDYPEMGTGPNPNTENGCTDPECTKTQSLVIYSIPLKKGKFRIAKLDKKSPRKNEHTTLSYIGNSGGLFKRYVYRGQKPGWIRVTKFDKTNGIVEGRFAISLKEDWDVYGRLINGMPQTEKFTNGLFRIKITDVLLR